MVNKKRNLKLVVNNTEHQERTLKQFFNKEWLFPRLGEYKTLHKYVQFLDPHNVPRRLLQIACLEQEFSQYFDDLSDNNVKLTNKKREFEAVIQIVFFAAFDNLAIGRFDVALPYFNALIYDFEDLDVDFADLLAPYLVTIAHLGLIEEFDHLAVIYPMIDQLLIFRLAKLYAHFLNEEYLDMDEEIKAMDELNPDYIDTILYTGLIESHISNELDVKIPIQPTMGNSFYDEEDVEERGPMPFPTPAYEEFVNHLLILMEFGLYPMILVDYIRTRVEQTIEDRSFQMLKRVSERSLARDRQEGLFIFEGVTEKAEMVLRDAGLVTFDDFLAVTEAEVLALKGVGKKTIETLKANDVVFMDKQED